VRKIVDMKEWGEDFRIFRPFETMLDDVAFEKYHMFRGQARVLSGFDEAPERKSPDPGSAKPPTAAHPTPH
jgi:hypothetical protein